jgi:hypothetical protein
MRRPIALVALNDPPNLTLVDDKAQVSFAYNGTCVTNSWDHYGSWNNKWWWQESSKGGSATRICSYAETDTYSTGSMTAFAPARGPGATSTK